jgi:hypothetical protein
MEYIKIIFCETSSCEITVCKGGRKVKIAICVFILPDLYDVLLLKYTKTMPKPKQTAKFFLCERRSGVITLLNYQLRH